jgi:hypothetical protein
MFVSLISLHSVLREFSRYTNGLWNGQRGFDSRQRQESFVYSIASRPALGLTQSPNQWVRGLKHMYTHSVSVLLMY